MCVCVSFVCVSLCVCLNEREEREGRVRREMRAIVPKKRRIVGPVLTRLPVWVLPQRPRPLGSVSDTAAHRGC